MKPALLFLFLCACAEVPYVKPGYELLRESQLMTPDDACKMLTDALASGDYSAQRRSADTLTMLNSEYQLGQAREQACRRVEKTQKRTAEIEQETDLAMLRMVGWSAGEDETLRRRAAERLRTLLADETRNDVLQALAAMEPPAAGLSPWYLSMGIEELIEDRLRKPEQDTLITKGVDIFAGLQEALSALGLAASENHDTVPEKAALKTAHTTFCNHLLSLTPDERTTLTQTLKARYPQSTPTLTRYALPSTCN